MTVPSAGGSHGETFGGVVGVLRSWTGLTQRELAAWLGMHAHTIQAWEASTGHP